MSTHRDVVGAIAEPWVDAERLAIAVGREPTDFGAWFHRYATRDRSVAVMGTTPPRPALRSTAPMWSLADICRAAASATRGRPRDIVRPGPTRNMFVALAEAQSWPSRRQVAEVCRADPSTIRRIASAPPTGIDAGLLCLGDRRLHGYDIPGLGGPLLKRSA